MKNKKNNNIISLFFFLCFFSTQIIYNRPDEIYDIDAESDLLNQYDGDEAPAEIAGQGKRDYTPASAKPGWHHKFSLLRQKRKRQGSKDHRTCRSCLYRRSKESSSVLHKKERYDKNEVENNLKKTVNHILRSSVTEYNKHLILDGADNVAADVNDDINKFIWKTVSNIITTIATEVTGQILQQGSIIAQHIENGADPVEATNMAMQDLMTQIKNKIDETMKKVETKTDSLNDDVAILVKENIKNVIDPAVRTVVIHAVKEAFKSSIDMHKDMMMNRSPENDSVKRYEEQPVEKINIDEMQPAM